MSLSHPHRTRRRPSSANPRSSRTPRRHASRHRRLAALKAAAIALQPLQAQDGSVPDAADHADARELRRRRSSPAIRALAPRVPARRRVPRRVRRRLRPLGAPTASACPTSSTRSWRSSRSSTASTASATSSCSRCTRRTARTDRLVEALLVEVDLARVHRASSRPATTPTSCSSRCGFVDFTPGYDTNSAVLFPETVAMREIPTFTWGAIFQDREAARYRRVVRAASEITKLELPADAARMLDDQELDREDLRDVGHHPRPHAHARRPAVRPVHDQAADAVLPLLARGAALRPDRVPRVAWRSSATARRSPQASAHRREARCSSTRSSCSTR